MSPWLDSGASGALALECVHVFVAVAALEWRWRGGGSGGMVAAQEAEEEEVVVKCSSRARACRLTRCRPATALKCWPSRTRPQKGSQRDGEDAVVDGRVCAVTKDACATQ